MEIYYGIEGKYVDVTYKCYQKLVSDGILIIPKGDVERAMILGDPLYGVVKHIKIGEDIYKDDQEVVLPVEERNFGQIRKNWWNETGKFIESSDEKLNRLHNYISIDFGNIKEEYPEQLMAIEYIKETDTVLEIGGNIGRNSCVIASILNDERRLVVLECGEIYAKQLEYNKNNNDFHFYVENSALSKVPLIQKGWNTYVSETIPEGFVRVKTITFPQLCEKYDLTFNVLVADCEGALYQILKDEPNLLDNIETIIIENDFTDITQKEYVHNKFTENGFKLVYNQEGGWGPCYSCFFQVYQK